MPYLVLVVSDGDVLIQFETKLKLIGSRNRFYVIVWCFRSELLQLIPLKSVYPVVLHIVEVLSRSATHAIRFAIRELSLLYKLMIISAVGSIIAFVSSIVTAACQNGYNNKLYNLPLINCSLRWQRR